MADTILGEMPDVVCSDCGTKGCTYQHWGPLVPSDRTGFFCVKCWPKRVKYYEEHGKPKPMLSE